MNLDQHRPIFIAATALALPLLALLWLSADTGPYETYGYPVFALYLLWVLWAYIRKSVPTRTLLAVSLLAMVVLWLGLMVFRLHFAGDPAFGVQRLTPDLYIVFIAISVVMHLLLTTRTALTASIGIFAATAAIAASWIGAMIGADVPAWSLGRLLAYEGYLAVTLLMLHTLAKSKDDHAEVLLEADRMRDLAYVDTVTGLPNRRRLDEDLERALSLTDRHERPLALILFDVDRFKKVNDTHGHIVGDEVLAELGRRVRSLLRAGDVFGRWGGEEFLIIAPETSHEQALVLAERLRWAIEQHPFSENVPITASFGVAACTQGTAATELVERADADLYAAKSAGRNRVCGLGVSADLAADEELVSSLTWCNGRGTPVT